MGDFSRTLGLGALASLPLWLGLIGIVLAARDLPEMAAAAIAGALAITLAGVTALAIVTRRSVRMAREHDVYVRQSLALVDCMKEINRRVMQIESHKGDKMNLAEEALAIETEMAPPLAVNDGLFAGASLHVPHAAPATPTAPAAKLRGKQGAVAPAPAAIPAAAPAPTPARAKTALGVVQPPAQPRLPRLEEVGIFHLDHGEHAGVRITLSEALAGETEALAVVLHIAERVDQGLTEIVLPTAPHSRNLMLGALLSTLPHAPALAERMLLGVTEPQLQAGGPAQMRLISSLVKAGLRVCLNDVEDLDLDGERLAASGVVRVALDAGWLTGRLAAEPDRVARWSANLSAHGVALAALNVPHRRMAMLLAAFDVAYGAGPGAPLQQQPPAPAVEEEPDMRDILPWRAMPRRKAG